MKSLTVKVQPPPSFLTLTANIISLWNASIHVQKCASCTIYIRHKHLHLRFLFTLVWNDSLLKCQSFCREHHTHHKWACVYFWQSVWLNPLRSGEVLHGWGIWGEVVTPAAKACQKRVVIYIFCDFFFFNKPPTHGIWTHAPTNIHMYIDKMSKDHIPI